MHSLFSISVNHLLTLFRLFNGAGKAEILVWVVHQHSVPRPWRKVVGISSLYLQAFTKSRLIKQMSGVTSFGLVCRSTSVQIVSNLPTQKNWNVSSCNSLNVEKSKPHMVSLSFCWREVSVPVKENMLFALKPAKNTKWLSTPRRRMDSYILISSTAT